MTMGRFDGAEVCELVGIYILWNCDLYRDDGRLILRYVNDEQIDWIHKNITKIFKNIRFAIDFETNLKIVDFLDNSFNFKQWCI